MPIIQTPFERIAIDFVGPLPKGKGGFQDIMVLIDYATRYPEAIPLRSTKAPVIAAVTEDLCPFRISLRSNNWPGDQLDE